MLYVHCYGYALNLAVKDSCIKVKCLKETFEAIREISLLFKKSPKRNTNLDEIILRMLKAFIPFVQRVGQFVERL